MARSDSTYIGQVASVASGVVRVRLRDDVPSTMALIDGESYRIGQIGAFLRIPLGYSQLYAVCTQVGADALPTTQGISSYAIETDPEKQLAGYRWMTIVLFGEAIGTQFERGVSQYPTVGDEVHLVTHRDLQVIYAEQQAADAGRAISIGSVTASSAIDARLRVDQLVNRHVAIVGSTGSGKSNLVTVLLEALASSAFKSARVLVIDPHGEYGSAVSSSAEVFRVNPKGGEKALHIPFWALPFDELRELTLGGLQPNHEASIREIVLDMKTAASKTLTFPPPVEAITADSPIPFSIRGLWYELDRFERMTFSVSQNQSDANLNKPEQTGDPGKLIPDRFPAASPYNQAPYKNSRKRNIERHLDLMANRLRDTRFSFLFAPGDKFNPTLEGAVDSDLDDLVASWIGHSKPITVLDVSGTPSEVLPTIVGTLVRVIYDVLFWADPLPISGRNQPLLILIDEAHRFVPEQGQSSAHRSLSIVAKEGRKYGVGLGIVSQRPSELDSGILSQCGSMIALRLTNSVDRAKISALIPDDLGGLTALLPSLRTGEALCVGEIIAVPSRIRVRKASHKPVGDDPKADKAWQQPRQVDKANYTKALRHWRAQSRE